MLYTVEINELALLFVVLVVGLLIRVIQYIRFTYPGGSDIFFHLVYIEDINEFYKKVQPYPFFFHFLSRKIKKLFHLKERSLLFIGVFPDLITSIILYLFSRNFFGVHHSILTMLLFNTTPILVHQSVFGPRSLGILLYTASLVTLFFPSPLNTISIPLISVTALTHKLSFQTLFFIILFYSITNVSNSIFLALGIILALIVSKHRYYRILLFHLTYIKHKIVKPESRYPNNEWLAFINVPYTIVLPLLLIKLYDIYSNTSILEFLNIETSSFWSLDIGQMVMLWGLITSGLVLLWRWGDSHRFISLGAFAFSMFSSDIFVTNIWLHFLIPTTLAVNIIITIYITRRNTSVNNNLQEAINFLVNNVTYKSVCCPAGYYFRLRYLLKTKNIFAINNELKIVYDPLECFNNKIEYILFPVDFFNNSKWKDKIQILFSTEKWLVGLVKGL